MRMHMIDYILWCATPAVMTAIAAYMLRGKLQRDFPIFFNYVVFQIATFAIEFPLRNWANYYYVYWVTEALNVVVCFAVLLEVVQKIAGKPKALRDRNIALFGCGAVAALGVAAVWPLASGHGIAVDNVTNIIYLVDRGVRIAACVVAVYVVLFGATVGFSKRNLAFGIAIGFGLFAFVNLVVMVSLSHASLMSKKSLSRVSAVAYVISMLIWLGYVATAAKKAGPRELSGA
jgi:hypothetical protein